MTWRPTIDIESDVHEVRAHPTRPDIVIAAAAIGLYISRDAGESWSVEREGLHTTYCSAVAFSGNDMLVSASMDHFADEGAVYRRSIDGNARWYRLVPDSRHGSVGLPIRVALPAVSKLSGRSFPNPVVPSAAQIVEAKA
ncbi:MAG TPA: hypothetical protein EYG57_12310 [Planctomycetes bacterium]|nr:hypothetical protein [Planctomycetaceae bacterium]HIM30312.1 hypothetical protein [Planctomycetota bacterium]